MMKQLARRNDRRRAGLTLLELVMVVSILAILTALVVPGMNDQQEETRKVVARATLQEIRDVIANRYMQDMANTVNPATSGVIALPQPNRLVDVTSRISTTQIDGSTAGVIPQLHFLFVNPNQYASASVPPYVAVNDYDQQTKIGWNGPYVMTKSTVYPNPANVRFPKDPNNTQTWAQYGFTTLYGQAGDFCVNDPWGSPYVVQVVPTTHGGSAMYTAYLVSAGPNRALDVADWEFNTDGSLNSGDDLALPIKAWK